jgi:monoamine oxidase
MMLGAPVAAALGCRGGTRTIDAALVDTGMARGHRWLRDAAAIPAPAARRTVDVAIVGGGVAGLAAAWWLDRAGVKDLVVLELDDVVGGTARGAASAVTPYPWGAHYIVAPQPHQTDLGALLADLGVLEDGVVAEQHRCRELEERVFYRGRWYEGLYLRAGASRDDLAQLGRFLAEIDRWVGWRDPAGRPAFTSPVSRCSGADEVTALDRLSMAAWLDARGLTSPRLRWLVDYGCRDDYGLTAEATSAWAGLFYFASRTAAPGEDAQSVVTWPDGNATLTTAIAARLGDRVLRGAPALRVAEADGRVLVDTPELRVDARRAIVATPRHVTRRLLGLTDDPYHPDVGAWAVANLHLHARPREPRRSAPLAWDNVLHDSPSLGYVTATHQRGRDHGPTVLTWYYPLTDDAASARARVAGAGAAEWAEVALADLERAHRDLRDLVDHVEVAFWGHGMVRPRLGATWSAARAAAARPHGRIHLAHTDLSGLALFEEALDHGVRAAREVLVA